MSNVLQTVGIEMPAGFPSAVVWRVHERVTAVAQDAQRAAWDEFTFGWNGLAYRFRACSDYSAAFAQSVREHGDAPQHEERYSQETALFGFFVNGLSAIESFGYGLHAIGSMLRPEDADLQMEDDAGRRRVKLESTRRRFEERFPKDAITGGLREVVDSPEFDEWTVLRNVLAHRSAPRRKHALTLEVGKEARSNGEWHDIPLTPELTEDRFRWLSGVVSVLLNATDEFVTEHF